MERGIVINHNPKNQGKMSLNSTVCVIVCHAVECRHSISANSYNNAIMAFNILVQADICHMAFISFLIATPGQDVANLLTRQDPQFTQLLPQAS